jgi:hypothetical protein
VNIYDYGLQVGKRNFDEYQKGKAATLGCDGDSDTQKEYRFE